MTTLGKYSLQQPLGRGGYGTVYLADEIVLKVQRAVKLLHPALTADPSFIERFRHEAQVAARLEHPHIVPVYELSEDQGRYYLAMKYMPGGSLKDLLAKEGRLPYERALQITQQVASALDFAHQQGLVHRDVKPGNILFEKDGTVRLADFGFSKAMHGASSASLSATGGMIGTPQFMAPELWSGKPATPATDVYSLACVLCEMLSGEVLFSGDSPAEIMKRHVLDGPQLPKIWPEDVPHGIVEVLRRALERQTEDRYQKPEDFVKVLGLLDKVNLTREKKKTESTDTATSVLRLDHAEAGKNITQKSKEHLIEQKATEAKENLVSKLDNTHPFTEQKQSDDDQLIQSFGDGDSESYQTTFPSASLNGEAVEKEIGALSEATFPVTSVTEHARVSDTKDKRKTSLPVTSVTGEAKLMESAVHSKVPQHNATLTREAGVTKTGRQDLVFWVFLSLVVLIIILMFLIPYLSSDPPQTSKAQVASKEVQSNKPNATLTAVQLNKNSTATASAAKLTATAQNHIATIEKLIATRQLLIEIENGELVHEDDGNLEVKYIYHNISDFILQAEFVNPYASTRNDWSYGVLFRDGTGNDQYRLSFNSDRAWRLENVTPGSDDPIFKIIHYGTIENLAIGESQTNQITLASLGKKGYLIVNGQFISELDLTARTNAGSVTLATGLLVENVDGEVTRFKNVYLYSSTINKTSSEATPQATSLSCKNLSLWPNYVLQDIGDPKSVKLFASFYQSNSWPSSGFYEISIHPSRDRSESSGYCEVKWPYPTCKVNQNDPRYLVCSGIIGVNEQYALVTTICVYEIILKYSSCGEIYSGIFPYTHIIK